MDPILDPTARYVSGSALLDLSYCGDWMWPGMSLVHFWILATAEIGFGPVFLWFTVYLDLSYCGIAFPSQPHLAMNIFYICSKQIHCTHGLLQRSLCCFNEVCGSRVFAAKGRGKPKDPTEIEAASPARTGRQGAGEGSNMVFRDRHVAP